jgi:hypothetical protein
MMLTRFFDGLKLAMLPLYRVDIDGLERLRSELDAYWGPALAALKDAAES